jgi:flagellar protein FliO/FliZ
MGANVHLQGFGIVGKIFQQWMRRNRRRPEMSALQPYMSSIYTAALLLGAIVLALLVFKALNRRMRSSNGARLGVSEVHEIDSTRKLILVRRDDVEHLLVIGGDHDLVVEQNIESPLHSSRPMAPALPTMPLPSPIPSNVQHLPVRPAPRPPVFGGSRTPSRNIAAIERPADPDFSPGGRGA